MFPADHKKHQDIERSKRNLMDFNKLPNALIIGAAKSGTTSLYSLLAEHKDVFVSKKKETWFFSNDDSFKKGGDWYQETYFAEAAGQAVRMEASPPYLLFSDKVAPRIKEFYQGHPLKFIAIFRDPTERAYSNYWHHVRLGHEPLSFPDAIRAEASRLEKDWQAIQYHGKPRFGYFQGGRYASQLKPYLNLFSRDQFFFLLQEDLQKDFEKRMAELLSFLEIDKTQTLMPALKNESTSPRNKGIANLYAWLQTVEAGNRSLSFVTKRLRKLIRERFTWDTFRYPPMDNEIEKYLRSQYLDEVKELELLINRDLSAWYFSKAS